MDKLIPPSQIWIDLSVKKMLGCISKERVKIGGRLIHIHDDLLCYHDLYHLEVSCLPRIKMGQHHVSGIHGINSPMFHDTEIIGEYDAFLDEARVAFHEWLTRTSFFNTLKLIGWSIWLMNRGINPIEVLISHLRVLNRDIIFYPARSQSKKAIFNIDIFSTNC
ncbi:hypothetical protein ACOWPH_05285 [Anabaena sp. PCC 7938]|uniref:Uncharacterized protein n=1 Tax=Anabaena cylindrica (strain ATCC 27899 / PCC 7122) TaxID=272123 RepID=K9ZEZ0_ANACC|nr:MULTISPECIES: hypothetical protein [Anabaena]AFZ57741.1 hypothetical protein Anacy_2285 [Anabaena cylindrica PCC 7122]AZL96647.1 hypothetical protein [Anabaena sp. CCAP 1446/1C]MCM2409165.1 hypothetical protein [Anabaena sp. CCAP 1446/1C]BAY05301.1 hypothetical protein NIES19_45720 [Anabaena cylindrica PCC 7122]